MTNEISKISSLIGAAVMIFGVISLIVYICERIAKFVKQKAYERKMKHRFDKPPIAKCYCKDCVYASGVNSRCDYNNNHGCDDWFCADATPRKHDPDQR